MSVEYLGAQLCVCLALVTLLSSSLSSAASIMESSKPHNKRAGSFVRIGKGGTFANKFNLQNDRDGNRIFPTAGQGSHDGLVKKLSSFVRIGRRDESRSGGVSVSDMDRQLMNTPMTARLGKKASSFVRIGKSNAGIEGRPIEDLVNILKKASSFVRIGKAPSFVRIGKSLTPAHMIRYNRNPVFVRIGKSDEEDDKRGSNFVRIGRRELPEDDFKTINAFENDPAMHHFSNIELPDIHNRKRQSSFVRIGKSSPGGLNGYYEGHLNDKRASSFVRIGKNQMPEFVEESLPPRPDSQYEQIEDEMPINVTNRAFIRLGKIPSAQFVRIGKSDNYLAMPGITKLGLRALKRRNQPSFVRIGKWKQ